MEKPEQHKGEAAAGAEISRPTLSRVCDKSGKIIKSTVTYPYRGDSAGLQSITTQVLASGAEKVTLHFFDGKVSTKYDSAADVGKLLRGDSEPTGSAPATPGHLPRTPATHRQPS